MRHKAETAGSIQSIACSLAVTSINKFRHLKDLEMYAENLCIFDLTCDEKSIKSCLNYELICSYQMINLQILDYTPEINNQLILT